MTKSKGNMTLEGRLAHGSSLPVFLQRRIQFRESISDDSAITSSFTYHSHTHSQLKKRKAETDRQGFTDAAQQLFPMERVKSMMEWHKVGAIGPGLSNLGNTCFLNSVMQCLTYTPPLANYLLAGEHGRICRVEGFCLVCELERHFVKVFVNKDRQRIISPNGTVAHLKWIAKHMRVGRQEDSHEFLRFVIEGMQKNLLSGMDAGRLDARVKESTLVHQVFGGYLQSRVKCLACGHGSSTFDALLDLSLEVRQADSIDRALRYFVQPERLCKNNRYRCEHCGKLSDADKAMSIYRVPNILTIHLKRFHMSPFGETTKINKHIEFPVQLDLAPYVSNDDKTDSIYDLYAVLVHEGQTCNSGHYHAFVRASNGFWYSMNDSSVHQVGLTTVLKQRAYLLFYTRRITEQRKGTAEQLMPISDPIAAPIAVEPAPIKADDDVKTKGLVASPPTPPATPEPVLEKDLAVQPAEIISNSMWHLTSTTPCKLPEFKTPNRRQSRPYTKWTVHTLPFSLL
jgi:ubiquitin carboxyl-terminal hydrolase 36/42